MNEDELAKLRNISKSDQTAADGTIFARNIAAAVVAYAANLKTSGMTHEDTMRLTENFQSAYVAMIGSMTALQNAMKGKE